MLISKLEIIESSIYQVKNQSGQDPLNFPIRVKNRNMIYSKIYSKNSYVKLNYLPPNHKDNCYINFKNVNNLKITEKTSSEIINLPCHPYMHESEITKLSKDLLKIIN